MKALTLGFFTTTLMLLGCGDSDGTTRDTTSPGTEVSDTSVAETATETIEETIEETSAETIEDTVVETDDDTSTPVGCDPYPLEIVPDPAAKTRAIDALAALAPGATMTWDDEKGTLTNIQQLNIPLTDCTEGVDFYEQAWAVVDAHPDIFQLDRSEWHPSSPLPCQLIDTDIDFFNVGRKTIGGQPVRKDVFVFVVVRVEGVVTLRGVNGFYLPATTPELTATLAACPELDTAAALEVVGKTPLPFATFFQCSPTGEGSYNAQPTDTLEFDSEAYWVWDDDFGTAGAHFQKLHDARLIVAEPNITPELLASDANCPAEPPATGRVIGFRITFDPVTGQLVVSFPGVGCIVC